jgi:hypothetical protein
LFASDDFYSPFLIAPLAARITQLENRAAAQNVLDSNRDFIPSQQWEKAMLQTVGKFVAAEIDKRAVARIAALEKILKQRRYVGVWAVGKYHEGNLVTHDGSMWHCNRETDSKPGQSDAWTLCVKRGRDGRDANGHATAEPRKPTAQPNGVTQ